MTSKYNTCSKLVTTAITLPNSIGRSCDTHCLSLSGGQLSLPVYDSAGSRNSTLRRLSGGEKCDTVAYKIILLSTDFITKISTVQILTKRILQIAKKLCSNYYSSVLLAMSYSWLVEGVGRSVGQCVPTILHHAGLYPVSQKTPSAEISLVQRQKELNNEKRNKVVVILAFSPLA